MVVARSHGGGVGHDDRMEKREKYPENEHHSTCLFTWESIAANSNNFEGYRSKYGWITVDAHKKFICEDIYRLRRM
jgi:hypothetical protein